MAGPSPHARGRRAPPARRRGRCGTIPARAGETFIPTDPTREGKDHPRTRGGDKMTRLRNTSAAGPSPHARGRRGRRLANPIDRWTIPARAGETAVLDPTVAIWRDHPRTRGGDCTSRRPRRRSLGPSPHARGRPGPAPAAGTCWRTIPARAGETGAEVRTGRGRVGPSPHARGRRGARGGRDRDRGTIPARAGETRSRSNWNAGRRDHPRTRGGDALKPDSYDPDYGPSPHARGRLAARGHDNAVTGTIPARAGETSASPFAIFAMRDHPRTRGGDHRAGSLR